MIVLQNGPEAVSLDVMTSADADHLAKAFAAMEPWSRYPFSENALHDYLTTREVDAPRFALHCNGKASGAIGIRWRWLRGAYLQFIGVTSTHQKRGIGHLMIAWFEDAARAAGERNLWVTASDFNVEALRFYERLGFARTATLDDLIKPGFAEVLMRKRLD